MEVDVSSIKFALGIFLGILGSVLINSGNNIQSLGLQQLQKKRGVKTKQPSKRPKDVKKKNHVRIAPSRNPTPSNSSDYKKIYDQSQRDHMASGEAETKEQVKHNSVEPTSKVNPSDKGDEGAQAELDPMESRTWRIGTVVFVTGSLVNFASYMFGAQSLLASLESIQFVTNVLYGKYMFGIAIELRMVYGTGLIVAGTILAIRFSSSEAQQFRSMDLIMLYTNPAYITYIFLSIVVGVLSYSCNSHYQNMADNGTALLGSNYIMPITYSIYSALFGTQSVTLAKSMGELVEAQASGEEDIFMTWFLYVNVIVWLGFVTIWLMKLNEALSRYDPLFIIPLLQANFIFLSIINGGIYFREFESFGPAAIGGFISGMCIMFLGLYFLRPISAEAPANPQTVVPDPGHPSNGRTLSEGSPANTSGASQSLRACVSMSGFISHPPVTSSRRIPPLSDSDGSGLPYCPHHGPRCSVAVELSPRLPLHGLGVVPLLRRRRSSSSKVPNAGGGLTLLEPDLLHRQQSSSGDQDTLYTPDTMAVADSALPNDEEEVGFCDSSVDPNEGSVASSNPSTEILPDKEPMPQDMQGFDNSRESAVVKNQNLMGESEGAKALLSSKDSTSSEDSPLPRPSDACSNSRWSTGHLAAVDTDGQDQPVEAVSMSRASVTRTMNERNGEPVEGSNMHPSETRMYVYPAATSGGSQTLRQMPPTCICGRTILEPIRPQTH